MAQYDKNECGGRSIKIGVIRFKKIEESGKTKVMRQGSREGKKAYRMVTLKHQ